MKPFIDPEEISRMLGNAQPTQNEVERIVEKALNKNRLDLEDVASLVQANDPEMIRIIKEGAKRLKEKVYGNRMVLFAPLYVGNKCSNHCTYCGFRASNKDAIRRTLEKAELQKNVEALERHGHKRLVLVFGEHKKYSADYIADTVKTVSGVKYENGEIRRVNINAAPLDIEGFRIVKEAGIGTYQVFQETYHPETYRKYHPAGKKADYNYRLTSLDRAMEADIDDVGIGALFGLYDWRFEVMGLVRHTNHLEACYQVGPHTISFPRIQKASGCSSEYPYAVSDEEFTRIVAILRLAVPYTGMILTARESASIRNEVLQYGCSQLDGGSKIEIGAYAEKQKSSENINREQFSLADNRTLGEVIDELIEQEYLPSFCTACYRLGRTGQHFMEFSVPGFIKTYCTPNAILTLAEYLEDYASESTAEKGWELIRKNIEESVRNGKKPKLLERLERIRKGERDLYF